MSKSIKISEEVYQELLRIQRPQETFSGTISRLLDMNEVLMKVEPLIEGQQNFLRERRGRLEKAHPVD